MIHGFKNQCSIRLEALAPEGVLALGWVFNETSKVQSDTFLYTLPLPAGSSVPAPSALLAMPTTGALFHTGAADP